MTGSVVLEDDGEDWQYCSPDGNVILRGHLVNQLKPGEQLKDGAKFVLDNNNGITVLHPSLISISLSTPSPSSSSTITPNNQIQTLRSLNSASQILSLHPSPSPSPSTTTPQAQEITLHPPLLTPPQLSKLKQTPLWSPVLQILLDGPGFPLPRFQPPPSPPSSSSHHQAPGGESPTIPRALRSPLLSPLRRPHSIGEASDSSVPPLNLNHPSRGRGHSLSRPPVDHAGSPSRQSQTQGLFLLLPSAQAGGGIQSTLHDSITQHAKKTAEDIMDLRRSHDHFVSRVKLELEVLEARAVNLGSSSSSSSPFGNGGGGGGGNVQRVVVKGFEESPSRSRGRSPSANLEGGGVQRGVSRTRDTGPERDEAVSRRFAQMDEKVEEEERGRSRSRTRGRGASPVVGRKSDSYSREERGRSWGHDGGEGSEGEGGEEIVGEGERGEGGEGEGGEREGEGEGEGVCAELACPRTDLRE
ncbi:hypothetical protein T439DRAFT_233538 [Meredithblackwellia eburnea MCA 4105]